MTERIDIEAEPRQKITVSLVGTEYLINPPKGATAVTMAKQAKAAEKDDSDEATLKSWELIEDWIKKAFGKQKAKEIQKRLDDDEDDLDIPHISQLISKVSELNSGNPTT